MKAQPWWYRVGVDQWWKILGFCHQRAVIIHPSVVYTHFFHAGQQGAGAYLSLGEVHPGWVTYPNTNQHTFFPWLPLWLNSQILMPQYPFVSLTSACLCQCWCPLTQSSKVVAKLSPSPPKLTSVFLIISSFLLIRFLIWLTRHWNLKDRKYFMKQKHLGIIFKALFLWR